MATSDVYIRLDPKQEKKLKAKLGSMRSKMPLMIARAANESIPTAKRTIAKSVQNIYILRQKDVNETLSPPGGIKATRARPTARLVYKSSHQNLAKWMSHGRSVISPAREVKSVWTQRPPDPKRGYKAHVMRGHPWTPLSGDPKPFLRTAGGGLGFYVRTSNSPDAGLRGVAAPDITQLISNPKVVSEMMEKTGSRFSKRLEHHIGQTMKGNDY